MSLDKHDLDQIRDLFIELFDEWGGKLEFRLEERIRAAVAYDMRVLINAEIEPRFQKIDDQLESLFRMESDDIYAAYKDIDTLKKRMSKVEKRLALLNQ